MDQRFRKRGNRTPAQRRADRRQKGRPPMPAALKHRSIIRLNLTVSMFREVQTAARAAGLPAGRFLLRWVEGLWKKRAAASAGLRP